MDELIITNQKGESITLGNQAPYFLEVLDGIGEVPVVIESQKSPYQDGSTYIDNVLENRAITVEGTIITKGNPDATLGARRKMQRVLNPKLGEVTIFYRDKEIKALAETTPIFPGGSGNRGLYYQKYLIHLLCHNPFWLDNFTESEEMIAWIGGLDFALTLPTVFAKQGESSNKIIKNAGDVDTPVLLEFHGPALNPKIENSSTGEFIRIEKELGQGQKLMINTAFGSKYIKLVDGDVEENAMHWIDLDSNFWQLKPGGNFISFSADVGAENAWVKVTWRNRYVGV